MCRRAVSGCTHDGSECLLDAADGRGVALNGLKPAASNGAYGHYGGPLAGDSHFISKPLRSVLDPSTALRRSTQSFSRATPKRRRDVINVRTDVIVCTRHGHRVRVVGGHAHATNVLAVKNSNGFWPLSENRRKIRRAKKKFVGSTVCIFGY